MKKLKDWLIVKISMLKKQNRYLRKELEETKKKQRPYIDKINVLKSELRKVKLENERFNNTKK